MSTNRWREEGVVRYMIAELSSAGWQLVGIDNGGGDYELPPLDADQRYAEIFAADDCHLKFRRADGCTHGVYLVYGNAPDEVINDFSYSVAPEDNFEATLNAVLEWAQR